MQMPVTQQTEDRELLRQLATENSEAAFAALVERHIGLVYSAALRQTGNSHAAEEITQAVFIILARKAGSLGGNVVLPGWLYQTARLTAANFLRTEIRRTRREQEAHMNSLVNETNPGDDATWQQIAPLLETAMGDLSEADRNAIVLRFFENKSMGEIAGALDMPEPTARKRVTRAVEKLRNIFAKRGVSVGASGLAVVISANAVQAAPVGLVATISAAALAGTAVSTAALVAATTKTIAMTTIQKTLVTATIAVLAGAGIYEARQAAQLEKECDGLKKRHATISTELQQLKREHDEVQEQLAALSIEMEKIRGGSVELLRLRGKVALLQNSAATPDDQAAKELLARVTKLKGKLAATPEASIPELQLLSDQDWLVVSRGFDLETANGVRNAFSSLRGAAEQKFADVIRAAVQKYAQSHDGAFPKEIADMQTYFDGTIDPKILERWAVLPEGTRLGGIGDTGPFVTQKAAVDELLDRRWAVGKFGYNCTDFLNSEVADTLLPVYRAYSAANSGTFSHDKPAGYLPYANTDKEKAGIQKLIEQAEIRK